MRSAPQCPPRASAIDRMYVPEDVQVEARDTVGVFPVASSFTVHRADGHLDHDPAPVERVRALAVDLHGRDRRNRQVDRAAQSVEGGVELVGGGSIVLLEPLAVDVARRRSGGEVDLGLVPLRQTHERALQARRRTGEEEQEPGCERIERPGVAGSRAGLPARGGDDRERGRTGGLVDEDDPARVERARGHYLSAPPRNRPAPPPRAR